MTHGEVLNLCFDFLDQKSVSFWRFSNFGVFQLSRPNFGLFRLSRQKISIFLVFFKIWCFLTFSSKFWFVTSFSTKFWFVTTFSTKQKSVRLCWTPVRPDFGCFDFLNQNSIRFDFRDGHLKKILFDPV